MTLELNEPETVPPSPSRVAMRAMVLSVVASRGFVENSTEDAELFDSASAWLRDLSIEGEIEPDEASLLAGPIGSLDRKAANGATWRTEGLGVLAWALDRYQLPEHDEEVSPRAAANSLGFLDPTAAQTLIRNARLRSADLLEEYSERAFAIHWRLVEYQFFNPVRIDFRRVARECSFGPLQIAGVRLIEGDLAIGGTPIFAAPEADIYHCLGIAVERHRAINWVQGDHPIYSEVDTST